MIQIVQETTTRLTHLHTPTMEEERMTTEAHNPQHIQVTDALIHVYLVLTQYLDHLLDESKAPELTNQDIESQLEVTRTKLQTALAPHPIVQGKIGEECTRILSEATMVMKEGKNAKNIEHLASERQTLQTKIVALTDLGAVFHAL